MSSTRCFLTHLALLAVLVPTVVGAETWIAEGSTHSGDVTFQMEHVVGTSVVTFKVTGPDAAWFSVGVPSPTLWWSAESYADFTFSENAAHVFENDGSPTVKEYNLVSILSCDTSTPSTCYSLQSSQDLSVISDSSTDGIRTVVYQRSMITGDINDFELTPESFNRGQPVAVWIGEDGTLTLGDLVTFTATPDIVDVHRRQRGAQQVLLVQTTHADAPDGPDTTLSNAHNTALTTVLEDAGYDVETGDDVTDWRGKTSVVIPLIELRSGQSITTTGSLHVLGMSVTVTGTGIDESIQPGSLNGGTQESDTGLEDLGRTGPQVGDPLPSLDWSGSLLATSLGPAIPPFSGIAARIADEPITFPDRVNIRGGKLHSPFSDGPATLSSGHVNLIDSLAAGSAVALEDGGEGIYSGTHGPSELHAVAWSHAFLGDLSYLGLGWSLSDIAPDWNPLLVAAVAEGRYPHAGPGLEDYVEFREIVETEDVGGVVTWQMHFNGIVYGLAPGDFAVSPSAGGAEVSSVDTFEGAGDVWEITANRNGEVAPLTLMFTGAEGGFDPCIIPVDSGLEGDADMDGVLDGCDVCADADDGLDADLDGTPDGCDLCPGFDDAADADVDTVPDGCDACPGFDDMTDADTDTVPDGCDVCEGFDDTADTDADTVPDGCDVCPGFDDTADADADTVPDGCDVCPGYDDTMDGDGDEIPDGCEGEIFRDGFESGDVSAWL